MVVAITMQSTGSAAARHRRGTRWSAALAGLVNGLIITYGRVNAVIATLGTMAIFRGFAFLTSGGQLGQHRQRAVPLPRHRPLLVFPC